MVCGAMLTIFVIAFEDRHRAKHTGFLVVSNQHLCMSAFVDVSNTTPKLPQSTLLASNGRNLQKKENDHRTSTPYDRIYSVAYPTTIIPFVSNLIKKKQSEVIALMFFT